MGVRVCAEMCDTCVFRPGNLMKLQAGRVADMIRTSVEADSAIICHKTLPAWTGSYEGLTYDDEYDEDELDDLGPDRHNVVTEQGGVQAVCKGFYDRYADRSWPLRFARGQGMVDFVSPPVSGDEEGVTPT